MERWLQAKQDKVWVGENIPDLEKGWDKKHAHDVLMKTVARLVVGESVLDVGCGVGHLYEYLPSNIKYVGVDQSAEMLKRARERNPAANFRQLNMYSDDFLNLPKFETVVCLDVLHHQPALEPAFSNLMNLTKKCLIATLWINDRDGHHPHQYIGGRGEIVTWYTEDELAEKFKGLNYTVHKNVGFNWKDIYCFEG